MDTANKPVDGDVDVDTKGEFNAFSNLTIKNSFKKNPGFDGTKPVSGDNPMYIKNTTDQKVDYEQLEVSKGKLVALVDAYGYKTSTGTAIEGLYPDMLKQLDHLAKEFINAFNTQHQLGHTLEEPSVTAGAFFSGDSARNFSVVITDPKKVAASDASGEEGNNKNMLKLSALQSKVMDKLQGGTFQSFYKSLIGDLGVKGQQAVNLEFNSTTLKLQIENNRASFNSVSLDEEMTNMITFQQAYNANARMITVIDETLDKIKTC